MAKHTQWAAMLIAVLISSFVSACGGGGGGSDVPSVSVSLASIVVEQRVSELARTVEFSATATWSPADGLYADLSWSGEAIKTASWTSTVGNRADIVVDLEAPGDVVPGVYTGAIEFKVCPDDMCNQQVRNSPLHIPVTLTVNPAEPIQLSWSPTEIILAHRNHNGNAPFAEISISTERELAQVPHVEVSYSESIVKSVEETSSSLSNVTMAVRLIPTDQFEDGTYHGFVEFELCYTRWCVNKVTQDPIRIPVSYTVAPINTLPEPGIDPLIQISTNSLPHDVVDAEYSSALDVVAMVAAYPASALYIFDVNARTELSVALTSTPTAVSVSPDGQFAAVGHDELVSYVDLNELLTTGSTAPTLLDVSANVFDVVLDRRGYVHAFPESDQLVDMHSIEVATGTETVGLGGVFRNEQVRLHASGDYIYGAHGLSPSDLEKFDITALPATRLYDSPYHGDFDICSGLWISDDGESIFTPCGNIFSASTTQADDMLFKGTLELWTYEWSRTSTFRIRSLSAPAIVKEIALVEYDRWRCPTPAFPTGIPCYTHLALYDRASLMLTAVYSFAPMSVDDVVYGQEGLFVFHSFDGSRRFAISKLENMPNPDTTFYLSELQPVAPD